MDKLSLINSTTHKIVDFDGDGEVIYYVNVVLDSEVRGVLRAVGVPDQWIDENKETEDGEEFIDLVTPAFEYCGAVYFSRGKFLGHDPREKEA